MSYGHFLAPLRAIDFIVTGRCKLLSHMKHASVETHAGFGEFHAASSSNYFYSVTKESIFKIIAIRSRYLPSASSIIKKSLLADIADRLVKLCLRSPRIKYRV